MQVYVHLLPVCAPDKELRTREVCVGPSKTSTTSFRAVWKNANWLKTTRKRYKGGGIRHRIVKYDFNSRVDHGVGENANHLKAQAAADMTKGNINTTVLTWWFVSGWKVFSPWQLCAVTFILETNPLKRYCRSIFNLSQLICFAFTSRRTKRIIGKRRGVRLRQRSARFIRRETGK